MTSSMFYGVGSCLLCLVLMSEALNSFSRCLIITVSRDHEGDKTK